MVVFLEEPTSSILFRFSALSPSGNEWNPSGPYDPGFCSSELLEASAWETLLWNDYWCVASIATNSIGSLILHRYWSIPSIHYSNSFLSSIHKFLLRCTIRVSLKPFLCARRPLRKIFEYQRRILFIDSVSQCILRFLTKVFVICGVLITERMQLGHPEASNRLAVDVGESISEIRLRLVRSPFVWDDRSQWRCVPRAFTQKFSSFCRRAYDHREGRDERSSGTFNPTPLSADRSEASWAERLRGRDRERKNACMGERKREVFLES